MSMLSLVHHCLVEEGRTVYVFDGASELTQLLQGQEFGLALGEKAENLKKLLKVFSILCLESRRGDYFDSGRPD